MLVRDFLVLDQMDMVMIDGTDGINGMHCKLLARHY